MQTQEISESTKIAYTKRAKSLIKQARKMSNKGSITSGEFVDCLNNIILPFVSASTRRQYRSAVIYYLKNSDCKKIDELLEKLESTRDTLFDCKVKSNSRKQKSLPINDYDVLKAGLNNSRSKYAQITNIWLYCGIVTGLRPCEWGDVTVNNLHSIDSFSITVKNAKSTQDRTHGEYRTIHIDCDLGDQSLIAYLAKEMEKIHALGEYDKYYQQCTKMLSRLTQKLWPYRKKRITLYSSRHQFCADLKAMKHSLCEIAALMGHAIDDTSTRHYGKRRVGNSGKGQKYSAATEEIQKIKLKHSGIKNTAVNRQQNF